MISACSQEIRGRSWWLDLYSAVADAADDPSTTTIRVQPGAFSVRSVLAVGAALTLSLTAMRLAGLQYAVPFGLIYIVVVMFPFCPRVTSRDSISRELKIAEALAACCCPAGRYRDTMHVLAG